MPLRSARAALVLLVAATAALAGCATRQASVDHRPRYEAQPIAQRYGRIVRMEDLPASGRATGSGAVVGGIAGAVIGRQAGSSTGGRDVGTVVGGLIGAVVGHQIERDQSGDRDRVLVTVAFDGGGRRRYEIVDTRGLRVGDRVVVEGGRVIPL